MPRKSLLKWAGSKRWLLDRYAHLLPVTPTGYREPFMGSAAVAANYLGRVPCYLSDRNERLVAMYLGVRDAPDQVIEILNEWPYEREFYDFVRKSFNDVPTCDAPMAAARFIYLNRICFNGLYRENRAGGFNVPFGRYTNPTICDEETIRAWSSMLKGATVEACGYEESLGAAKPGEFVFLDPPYVPASNSANFTEYQAGGFGTADQERLAGWLTQLDARGCKWMLTNSAEARGLYSKWNVLDVQVARAINSNAAKRGLVGEIIVANYDMIGAAAPASEAA